MLVSFDGRVHPSRWTERPDGDRSGWSRLYERVHDELAGDAWLVGRVTMAEMGKAGPRPCVGAAEVERPHHFARRGTSTYAVALDRSGKLHFASRRSAATTSWCCSATTCPRPSLPLSASPTSSLRTPRWRSQPSWTCSDGSWAYAACSWGGGHVNGSLLAAGLVDQIGLLVAPDLDGGEGVTGVFDAGAIGLAGKIRLRLLSAEPLDQGLLHLRYAADRP